MRVKKLNEMLTKALNEETICYYGMPYLDLPTGIINLFYNGTIDIEKIYYMDVVREWFDSVDDKEFDDIFFGLMVDYTPEDEVQLSRREKEIKILEQSLYAAYEDSERKPDYKEEDYTDRVDDNFDISLFEYGIVRNPKDNSVIFGEKPNGDTGLYEDYSFATISYEDVKKAIEEMKDDFFDFIDTPKEDLLKEIEPEHLAYYIMCMNQYNGKFHESIKSKKSGKKSLKENITALQDFCKTDGKIIGRKQLTDKLFNLYYSEGIDGLKNTVLPFTKGFIEYVDFDKMAQDILKIVKNY